MKRSPIDLTHDAYGLIRLSENACWQFLEKHSIGRVGIVDQGAPMVFPVNYALDGRSVVFRTAPGTKLELAARGRQAAFEVDDAFDVLETGTSVMLHGKLELVRGAAELAHLATLDLRSWAPGGRDRFVRVNPLWLSGRRIPVHSLAAPVDPPTKDT
jgi:uncharacterized protein